MKTAQAIEFCLKYHEANYKKNILINYQFILSKLKTEFGNRDIREINQDDIFTFLNRLTNGNKQNTKRNRFTTLSAFFNFIANTLNPHLLNPEVVPKFWTME